MVVQKGTTAVASKAQISAASQGMNYEQIAQDPLKHVVTFIEKKIRNLDKRKAKLDGYRKMVEDGKPLDPDQTAAASKYDEVLGSLDFAKELVKAFEATTNEVLKLQRKSARREQMAKEENDNNRVCFVLRASRIMELLHGEQFIREDFLIGTNDACVVSKVELDQLVNFYECFIMKSYEAGTNVTEDANSAGNHMYELAEGRSKDIVGTTYKELRALLERISDCKYFEDLPDTNKAQEAHLPALGNEVPEESSESSADEEDDGPQPKQEQSEKIVQNENIDAMNTLSNNQIDSITTGKDLAVEATSKGDEIMATTDVSYHPPNTDSSWQQQPVPAKPEAGDYIMQGMNLQYSSSSNQMLQQTQHPAYRQMQTIQDVLAEVQGPCQFLQESFIDFDVGSIQSNNQTLPYTGIDTHQQPTTTTLPSATLNHQADQGLVVTDLINQVALEPGFPNQQKGPAVDQASMSHLPSSRDSPSNLTNNVSHPDHINPSIEHIGDSLHGTSAQQEKDMTNDSSTYSGSLSQTSYLASKHPTSTSSSVTNQQSNLEYLDHPLQSQTEHQQQINLSFGQTTFGGQQLPAGGPGLQQDSNATPDPPTTHIPLPNEQQSGYRSYQPNENTQSNAGATTVEAAHDELNVDQDVQNVGEMKQERTHEEDEEISQNSSGQSRMSPKESSDTQMQHDHRPRYGSRNADNRNQHMGGGPGRSRGYGTGGGYRSGPINQGGGTFHSQRNSNYRSNSRYNGNYDSMGRPSNYSGNYQNNQPGYGMYRPQQQDGYSYNRRAAGGNMRGGRGGHPTRGGQRGGGNYNRSRTFRTQHSNEQAA